MPLRGRRSSSTPTAPNPLPPAGRRGLNCQGRTSSYSFSSMPYALASVCRGRESCRKSPTSKRQLTAGMDDRDDFDDLAGDPVMHPVGKARNGKGSGPGVRPLRAQFGKPGKMPDRLQDAKGYLIRDPGVAVGDVVTNGEKVIPRQAAELNLQTRALSKPLLRSDASPASSDPQHPAAISSRPIRDNRNRPPRPVRGLLRRWSVAGSYCRSYPQGIAFGSESNGGQRSPLPPCWAKGDLRVTPRLPRTV